MVEGRRGGQLNLDIDVDALSVSELSLDRAGHQDLEQRPDPRSEMVIPCILRLI